MKKIPRYIIIKLLKTSCEKKILKSNREGGKDIYIQRSKHKDYIRNSSEKDMSVKIMERHPYSTRRARAGQVREKPPT